MSGSVWTRQWWCYWRCLTYHPHPTRTTYRSPNPPLTLTPWSCTAHQDVRHSRTPRTITIMFTKSCHGTPWAGWVQSIPSRSNYRRSILILSSHLHQCLQSGHVPLHIPAKFLYSFHSFPRRYKSHQSHHLCLIFAVTLGTGYQSWNSSSGIRNCSTWRLIILSMVMTFFSVGSFLRY
jgi:hypothetical protein